MEPSPWLSPWAIALEAVLVVAIATLFLRARERALRKRAESLEALVGQRTLQLSEANARLAELSAARSNRTQRPSGGGSRARAAAWSS